MKRIAIALAMILPATAALASGGTVSEDVQVGPRIGVLYAVNTFGAIAGTLVSAFVFLPAFGLRTTVWIGIAGNAVVFLAAAALARGLASVPTEAEGAPAPRGVAAPALGEEIELCDGAEFVEVHPLDVERGPEPVQGPFGRRPVYPLQRIAGLDDTGPEHPIIPSGAARGLYAPGHVGKAEAVIELPAGLAALRNLEQRGAEAEDVTDRDIALGESRGSDVLAKGAGPFQQR